MILLFGNINFAFFLGFPILNKKLPKFISYRWNVVVVILALLIGAILDFDSLSDDVRHCLLVGGMIIVGGYVALRTIEKALANGWLRGTEIEATKGDIKVTGKFGQNPNEDNTKTKESK